MGELLDISCSTLLGCMPGEASQVLKVSIELNVAEGSRLREEAARLGVDPQDLARATLADLLRNEDESFREAAQRVPSKNKELCLA